MNDFYKAALKIADQKIFRDEVPGKLRSPRLGTGGGFKDVFLWDTVFSCQWAKYHLQEFPLMDSLDNFYLCQDSDGFISRQISSNGISCWSKEHPVSFAPPLLSWIELDLYENGFITDRLPKIYPCLKKLHEFNKTHWLRPDGLYFSDCWGCGMDDLPRWNTRDDFQIPGGIMLRKEHLLDLDPALWDFMQTSSRFNFNWNRQLGWVDTSCQAAFDALNLSRIAHILNNNADEQNFRDEHSELAERINLLCYDEDAGFYCDRLGNGQTHRKLVGGFWALISQVATPDRAERLFDHLQNPATFGLPCGIPSISFDDPEFAIAEGHYWRGPVWCPTEYMVLRGLQAWKQMKLAHELAVRFYESTRQTWERTGTIWENYSPLKPEQSPCGSPDFCGWSALAPISIYREFVDV